MRSTVSGLVADGEVFGRRDRGSNWLHLESDTPDVGLICVLCQRISGIAIEAGVSIICCHLI